MLLRHVNADSLYLLTYLLTPWCRFLLEKLTGLQLVKKFPAFYGTRRFITAFISFPHPSLSRASPIQSTCPQLASWRSIHLRLGLPSGLFPSGFPTRTLYAPSPPPYEPHARYTEVFNCFTLQVHNSTEEITAERMTVNGRYAATGTYGLQIGRCHRSYASMQLWTGSRSTDQPELKGLRHKLRDHETDSPFTVSLLSPLPLSNNCAPRVKEIRKKRTPRKPLEFLFVYSLNFKHRASCI